MLRLFYSFEFRNKEVNKIIFNEFGVRSGLKHRVHLKKYLTQIFYAENVPISSVRIIFTHDQYLRSLNKKYLKHNYNTDTISFILSEKKVPIIGEGYISIEHVKKNATRFNVSYQNELIRVIIHSCLHMAGYKDTSIKATELMHNRQEKYIKDWASFT